MKVGDLVRWTHPHAVDDVGLVFAIANGNASIVWQVETECNGDCYSCNSEYLEVISEDR